MSDIGSDAVKAGFGVVPNTGPEGKVKFGAREIMRTRDYIAQLLFRVTAYGTEPPNNDDGKPDGTFYHQII